jgi:hypothetical protein
VTRAFWDYDVSKLIRNPICAPIRGTIPVINTTRFTAYPGIWLLSQGGGSEGHHDEKKQYGFHGNGY